MEVKGLPVLKPEAIRSLGNVALGVLRHPEAAGPQMPLPNESRVIACFTEQIPNSMRVLLGTKPHKIHHGTRVAPVFPGHQHTPIRRTERRGGKAIGKSSAFLRHPINIVGGDVFATVYAAGRGPKLVCEEKK